MIVKKYKISNFNFQIQFLKKEMKNIFLIFKKIKILDMKIYQLDNLTKIKLIKYGLKVILM